MFGRISPSKYEASPAQHPAARPEHPCPTSNASSVAGAPCPASLHRTVERAAGVSLQAAPGLASGADASPASRGAAAGSHSPGPRAGARGAPAWRGSRPCRIDRALAILVEGVRGQRDDRQPCAVARADPALAQLPGRVEAVEVRHLAVHQHQVVFAVGSALQRGETVLGLLVGQPEALEHRTADGAIDRVVLDHQHASLEPARRRFLQQGRGVARRRGGQRQCCRRRRYRDHRHRQAEPEGRACARRAVDADQAAHQAHQAPADREAQARATVAARVGIVGLSERIEDPIHGFRRDADAGVAHGEADPHRSARDQRTAILQRDAQFHVPALGELQRVADEVVQHLAHAQRIAEHAGRQVGCGDQSQFQPGGARARQPELQQFLDQAARLERRGHDLHLLGLDLGEVEHVVDDLAQVLARLAQQPQVASLARVERGALQQVGEAQHAVERRANLVAHRGEEA